MGDEYNNDRNKLMDFVDIEIKHFNERILRYESRCESIYYDTNKLTEWKKEELFHFANELKEKMQSLTIYSLNMYTKEEKRNDELKIYEFTYYLNGYEISRFAMLI
jgi:hypothetical protein